jgi:hypothetical protein
VQVTVVEVSRGLLCVFVIVQVAEAPGARPVALEQAGEALDA